MTCLSLASGVRLLEACPHRDLSEPLLDGCLKGQAKDGAQASVRKAGRRRSGKAVSPEAAAILVLRPHNLSLGTQGSPEGRKSHPQVEIRVSLKAQHLAYSLVT